MIGKRVFVFVGVAALALSTFAMAAPKTARSNAGIAAVVNGEKITSEQLRDSVYKWYAPQGIEELIMMRLVDREAKKTGVVVTDAQVKARIADIGKRASSGGNTFEDYLKQNGKTLAYATAMIKMDLQANGILRKITKVTPQEVAEYRKANHILIINVEAQEGTPQGPAKSQADMEKDAKEKIEKIAQEIKDGLSFEDAAKKYSQDTMTKDKGGDLGWFTHGRMAPEFEKAVYELKNIGEISGPVKSPYGYHIIKLTAIGNDVQGADKKALEEQIIQGKINVRTWITQLRQNAKVQSSLVAKPRTQMPATKRSLGTLTPMPPRPQRMVPAPAGQQTPPPPPAAPPAAPAQTK
jgi:foldase protein PrsA